MQTSLKSSFSLTGTGLHSGRPVRLAVHPAAAGHGIRFRRTDIRDRDNKIPATYDRVVDTTLCSCLGNEAGVRVSTVEHLMAALAGCGVHNARIDVDGPEIPILDGSSARFVKEILHAGVAELDAPVRAVRVLKTVRVADGDATAELSPSEELFIEFEISFPDRAIGRQAAALPMANGAFVSELSDCRTFCRRAEITDMQSAGLARGGSLDNAVVVDGDVVLNPGGFRRKDECVRHKMLDALGDLSLAGVPVLGRYRGVRAGHAATNAVLKALFATPGACEFVTCTPQMESALPGNGINGSVLSNAG
ncbi:MAG: UDP-3-O-acyl-N-acetylglucosamine deacetylase [Paracoccaceae bacterium]